MPLKSVLAAQLKILGLSAEGSRAELQQRLKEAQNDDLQVVRQQEVKPFDALEAIQQAEQQQQPQQQQQAVFGIVRLIFHTKCGTLRLITLRLIVHAAY